MGINDESSEIRETVRDTFHATCLNCKDLVYDEEFWLVSPKDRTDAYLEADRVASEHARAHHHLVRVTMVSIFRVNDQHRLDAGVDNGRRRGLSWLRKPLVRSTRAR
jgi:hypothetical protein